MSALFKRSSKLLHLIQNHKCQFLTLKKYDFQTVLNFGRERDKERNEKVARVSSCMRYYVIVHIEDNSWITKCSNEMIYEILGRKLISSCYRLPRCRGEMKEKLYIKRPCSALCLSHFIFQVKSFQ